MRSNDNAEPIRLPRTALVNAYYSWLCGLVNIEQPTRNYWLLAKRLYNTPFYWSVPNDDNRAFEGKELRERFCRENNIVYIPDYFPTECTMFELIIGLACRCDGIMVDQCEEMTLHKWFWDILANVGLSKFTDEVYYDIDGNITVDQILSTVVNRTYHRNGRGGLFPLNHSKQDQRKVELWYQMSGYLVENYYGDD